MTMNPLLNKVIVRMNRLCLFFNRQISIMDPDTDSEQIASLVDRMQRHVMDLMLIARNQIMRMNLDPNKMERVVNIENQALMHWHSHCVFMSMERDHEILNLMVITLNGNVLLFNALRRQCIYEIPLAKAELDISKFIP